MMLGPRAAWAQIAPQPSPTQAPIPTAAPTPTPVKTPPPATGPQWVQALLPLPLWSGPDDQAEQLGVGARLDYFQVVKPQNGPRLQVEDPYAGNTSYLDATLVGPVDPPARLEVPSRWWGSVAVDGANLRSAPTTKVDALAQVPSGSTVIVQAWVTGDEVIPD